MELKKHRRLSYKERVITKSLLEENKFKYFIDNNLGKSRLTIPKDVNKWTSKPGEYHD